MSYQNFPYQAAFQAFQQAASQTGTAFPSVTADSTFVGSKRRRVDIQDNSTYQQWKRYKVSGGRRRRRLMPMLASNIIRLDYTFKGLKDFVSHGYFPMQFSQIASPPDGVNYQMPLYVFCINGCNQVSRNASGAVGSGVFFQPMRRYNKGHQGSWYSSPGVGQHTDGSAFAGLIPTSDQLEDPVGAMGPKGYLNWTSIYLNLWGARLKQTVYYIDICRATDPEGNPFRSANNAAVNDVLAQHLDEIMRPLTVNPLATANNLTKSPWKVLKRIKVDLDPISTTEGDQDPHVKTINLFNRWGRVTDFKQYVYRPDMAADDSVNFQNPASGIIEQFTSVIENSPEEDKMLFLVIRCNVFSRQNSPNTDFDHDINPSFDIKFRSSWSKLN